MTILITGSSGFIGSYLAKIFSKEYKILYFDLPNNIADLANLEPVFQKNKIDIVIHTAAQKYVDKAEKNPLDTLNTNIIGTYNVFMLCNKYKVTKCIYFSTDKAEEPINIYGITKNVGEQLLNYFVKQSNTAYIALRPCNIYGSTGSVVPIFEEAIKNDLPVKITDIRMSRYFMTLDNVVELVDYAINKANSGDILLYKILEPTLILDIAKDLCRKYNKPFKYELIGNRGNEKLCENYSLDNCEQVAKNIFKKNIIDKP